MTPAINHDTDSAVELHRILTACLTRRFQLADEHGITVRYVRMIVGKKIKKLAPGGLQ